MKLIFLVSVALLLSLSVIAQNPALNPGNQKLIFPLQNTIDTRKTSNSQDVLTNLFQASISNLLGSDKSFEFKTSFYGIDSFLFVKHRSNIDTFYDNQRLLRGIQLGGSIKANDENKLSQFQLNATIALINRRDITYADFSRTMVPMIQQFEPLRKRVNDSIIAELERNHTNESTTKNIMDSVNASWEKWGITDDYTKLDPEIISHLTSADAQALNSGRDNFIKKFGELSAEYAQKALLTVSPSFSYDWIQNQPSFSMSADYLKGFGKSDKPWEFEGKSSLTFSRDTSIEGGNIKNQVASFSVGVNKVLRQNSDHESTMELKGFFEYDHQLGNVPPGSEPGKVTFNTTFRARVFKAFWIPVTLSYDVKHHNLFGFLSITANIDGGKSSLK